MFEHLRERARLGRSDRWASRRRSTSRPSSTRARGCHGERGPRGAPAPTRRVESRRAACHGEPRARGGAAGLAGRGPGGRAGRPGRSGAGSLVLLGVARGRRRRGRAAPRRQGGRAAHLRGRGGQDEPRRAARWGAASSSSRSSRCSATRARGTGPSFIDAAPPGGGERALRAVLRARCASKGLAGRDRASSARTMEVELVNDGPVTILLDSRRLF